jgi:hypothetical protein
MQTVAFGEDENPQQPPAEAFQNSIEPTLARVKEIDCSRCFEQLRHYLFSPPSSRMASICSVSGLDHIYSLSIVASHGSRAYLNRSIEHFLWLFVSLEYIAVSIVKRIDGRIIQI